MGMVISILTALGLALGVVSWGMDVNTAAGQVIDQSYLDAADRLLREHRLQAEEELAAARRQGDEVAVAEARVRRDTLILIENRASVAAQKRQLEQARASFIEEGQRKALIDIATGLISRKVGGFGQVRDHYIRGNNWPPDPSKSIVLFNPSKAKAVRIIMEANRPSLNVIEFSDKLEDTFTIIIAGFDVLKGTAGSGGQTRQARGTFEVVKEGLERLGKVQPLPDTVGDYLAQSLVRQARAANPQIAGLPEEEEREFVREQVCSRLQGMMIREADLERSAAIREAQEQLGCPLPAARAAQPTAIRPAATTHAQPPTATRPAAAVTTPTAMPTATVRVPTAVRTATATATPTATATATVTPTPTVTRTRTPMPMELPAKYLGTYTIEETCGTTSGEIELTLLSDGSIGLALKALKSSCASPNVTEDGTVRFPKWTSYPSDVVKGTHADGSFAFMFGPAFRITGTYDAQAMQGRGEQTGEYPITWQISGTRIPMGQPRR